MFGDRWASLIQPVPVVADDANAVAAAGMPSSRADAAKSMSNRLVSLDDFMSTPPNNPADELLGAVQTQGTWGVELDGYSGLTVIQVDNCVL